MNPEISGTQRPEVINLSASIPAKLFTKFSLYQFTATSLLQPELIHKALCKYIKPEPDI